MEDDEATITRVWTEAGEDLGIDVIVPAEVTVGSVTIRTIALLPQFGNRNGMVVFGSFANAGSARDIMYALADAGYGVSHVLSETYDRDNVVNMLNDWGWTSDEPPPDWYTGEPEGD